MRVQSLLHKNKRRRVFDVGNSQDPENEGVRIAWNSSNSAEAPKTNSGSFGSQKSNSDQGKHNWTVIEDEIAFVDDDVENFLSGAKRPQVNFPKSHIFLLKKIEI